MRVVHIEDLADPELDDFTRLTDVALRRRLETDGGLYLAESAKVIQRALAAGHRPRAALLQEVFLAELAPLLEPFDVPVFVASAELLASITGFDLHRGALVSMHRPELPEVAEVLRDARRVVVLEDLADHTNVGAIFRAAAGLGADAVLVTPRCADPLYRRSVRVSMGTVLQVPWTRIPWWPEGSRLLREAGFTIAALALSDDAVDLGDFADAGHEKVAIVMGSEGDGLSRRALQEADAVVTIPMQHGVDSLNVAAAASVALWALRPRG